jgi:hypothetical protein
VITPLIIAPKIGSPSFATGSPSASTVGEPLFTTPGDPQVPLSTASLILAAGSPSANTVGAPALGVGL